MLEVLHDLSPLPCLCHLVLPVHRGSRIQTQQFCPARHHVSCLPVAQGTPALRMPHPLHFPLDQSFSPEDIWKYLGTFLFVTTGDIYWYLVDRDQGCHCTSYNAQDNSPQNLAPYVNSSKRETLCSRPFLILHLSDFHLLVTSGKSPLISLTRCGSTSHLAFVLCSNSHSCNQFIFLFNYVCNPVDGTARRKDILKEIYLVGQWIGK